MTELQSQIEARLSVQDFDAAVTLAVRGLGPEIFGFLLATQKSPDDAAEIFSQFCEDLWKGVRGYRSRASFRTWAYTLARHAASRHRRDPYRRRGVPLSQHPALAQLAERVRTTTLTHQRSEVREKVLRLREALTEEERTLLVLRVDRQLGWEEIAIIMSDDANDESVRRQSALLRKRFQRLKSRLRELARKDA